MLLMRRGCTIAFVDHTPWAEEGRRTPSRGYGSVFKAAAVRFTIHIDKAGEQRWIDAHGNNTRGLVRTAARFNAATLELELVGEEESEPPEPSLREMSPIVGRRRLLRR
jgi:HEAT repeat protein